jgi:hypothetical protein
VHSAFSRSVVFFTLVSTLLAPPFEAAAQTAPAGKNILAIGHSFFIPILRDHFPGHIGQVGIVDHSQQTVFSGGATGAPQALWENQTKSDEIKAILDVGDIELMLMTYHPDYPDLTGYRNWIGYALNENPDTVFMLGLPWMTYPGNFDAPTYDAAWQYGHDTGWHDMIAQLRAEYPGVPIHCIPYGRTAGQLYQLFEQSNLPDVSSLVGTASSGLYTDDFGHGGNIIKDQAALVFLNAIYGIDLDSYVWNHGYTTDILDLAATTVAEHAAAHPEPPTAAETFAIRATKLMMRDDAKLPLDPTKRKLAFRSSPFQGNPSGVSIPAFASAGDPSSTGSSGGGATLTIYKTGGTSSESVSFTLPAENWQQSGSESRPGYKYDDKEAAHGSISKIRMRSGSITIVGKGEGLYPLAAAPQGSVSIRLELGTGAVLCAEAAAKDPAGKNDTTARFLGDKASPPPASCLAANPLLGSASQAFLAPGTGLFD